MRWRHLSLLHAVLFTCVASGARAQALHETSGPTHVVVNMGGAIWTANEIKWPGAAPGLATPRPDPRRVPAAQPRIGKWASNSVEIISAVANPGPQLQQWTNAIGGVPMDVSITVTSAAGTPLLKYLLVRAVTTKVWVDQMDASGSQPRVLHVTLTAQSITAVPLGT